MVEKPQKREEKKKGVQEPVFAWVVVNLEPQ
jgi:hypothetical protein